MYNGYKIKHICMNKIVTSMVAFRMHRIMQCDIVMSKSWSDFTHLFYHSMVM
jgi:hypothetical protein